MDETLIYVAITKGRNRLEISGALSVYHEFLVAITGVPYLSGSATVYNPAPEISTEYTPPKKN
jgi:hypothetical protein